MDYWYTDVDIHLLLNHKTQQDIHVCQAITEDVQQASKQLNDVVKIFSENKFLKAALIPINLGNNMNGVFIGSHWTALVLINNNDTNISALFADPLGNPIEISIPIINKLLTKFQIPVSFNSTIKQQTNDYDCGPLTVFNLYCLAKIGKLPNSIDDTFIFQQRTLLCKLKETKLTAEEKQVILVPDNYSTREDSDILDCLPRSRNILQLTDTLIIRDDNNISSLPRKQDNPHRLEIHQNIISSRDTFIKSHDKFKEKSSLSLEDDTLDILQSIPHNKITEEIINTNQDLQNRLKEMKRKDIKRLIEMVDVINSCITNEMQLSVIFIKLGNLSGGSDKISYNDTDENCIRNKYGYVRRHKNATINNNGIYFEKLYQIKLVIEAKTENDQINFNLDVLEKNSENLKKDLINIKMIISSILEDEKEFLPEEHKSIINEFTEPIDSIMEHIIKFANVHYYPMILDRIKQELSRIEIFNIDNRENRYYLARVLTIIGELSREYIEHNSSINNDDTREMFKHFRTMRNLFIHCHDKIINGIPDNEQRNCTNNNISYILKGLNESIENGSLKSDYDYKKINENIQSLKRIFSKSHVKNIIQNSYEISQKNNITNQSNHINIQELIRKAFNILSENPKKISKQLAALDRKYQDYINQISDINDNNYPPALQIDHKQSIETYFQKEMKYSVENVTRECQNSNKSISDNLQISTNENVKIVNDRKSINKNKTEIIKLIKQAQKILSENKANLPELLEKLDQKYQILIQSLNDESSDQYPSKLDETNSNIIDRFVNNLQQAKISRPNINTKTKESQEEDLLKSDKLNAKIKELVDETEYLIIFEKTKFARDSDRSYVVEHIISVIGQIMRDITNLNSHLKALQTSHVHDSASKSAVSSRNQGLAHDIFAFDKHWLDKQILNNILPAHQHFQAILTILKKDNCEISRITLFSIAFSYLRLGLYDHAVDYFKRTIEYISKHPDEIKSKNHGRINIFQALFHININTSFEELMGIDIYSFTSRVYLMQTYIIACKYDEAYRDLEILKKNMQIHRIMAMKDKFISCFVHDVYNGMVHCLLIKGDNKTCINLLNEIIPISNYHFFKVNLAKAYHFENIPEKAYEIITSVLPCIVDPIDKYHALYFYVRILSYQPNKKESIKESNKAIKEMENLFMDNYKLFKEKYDDEFLIMQSHLVRLKVQSLVDKAWLPDNDERAYETMIDELEEHISQFNGIIKFIKHDLEHDVRIASMYFWICRAYSALVSDNVSNIESEKSKVENAQKYFDKARARLDFFKQTGRISVSSIKEMIKTADYLAYGYNKLASRNEMEEELRNFYIDKAAPYMAMVKRYIEQYQSSNMYIPLFAQVKSSFLHNKTIDCEQDMIEKAIVDKFIESKIRPNTKDVNIGININKSLKDKLKNYCCSVLKLEQGDIEFDNNICWISLGRKNIEILRKIVDKDQNKK